MKNDQVLSTGCPTGTICVGTAECTMAGGTCVQGCQYGCCCRYSSPTPTPTPTLTPTPTPTPIPTSTPSQCDGVRLGGVCVPWWIIGIVAFVVVLMVIVLVRR